jgi:hypothetical protein
MIAKPGSRSDLAGEDASLGRRHAHSVGRDRCGVSASDSDDFSVVVREGARSRVRRWRAPARGYARGVVPGGDVADQGLEREACLSEAAADQLGCAAPLVPDGEESAGERPAPRAGARWVDWIAVRVQGVIPLAPAARHERLRLAQHLHREACLGLGRPVIECLPPNGREESLPQAPHCSREAALEATASVPSTSGREQREPHMAFQRRRQRRQRNTRSARPQPVVGRSPRRHLLLREFRRTGADEFRGAEPSQ